MHATAERRNDAHPAFLQRKCGCGGSCGSCGSKKNQPLDRAAGDAPARAQIPQAGGVNRSATGVSAPDDATELAADRAAETVMAGGTPSIASGGAGVLHRSPPKIDPDPWEGNWATCKIDFAKWGDWGRVVDCCANIDPLGKGCISDLQKLRGSGRGKGQPPKPGNRKPIPGLDPDLPPIPKCVPPARLTLAGKCALPKLTPRQPEGPEKPPEQPPAAKPAPLPAEIAFQFDKPSAVSRSLKTSTTSEGQASYDALLAMLEADTTLKVTLIGRASPEGKDAYNEDLGGRRASAVADALLADGIDASRIADVPGGVAGAKPLRKGVVTTGESGATGKTDRQVRVVFFR